MHIEAPVDLLVLYSSSRQGPSAEESIGNARLAFVIRLPGLVVGLCLWGWKEAVVGCLGLGCELHSSSLLGPFLSLSFFSFFLFLLDFWD